MNSLWIRIIGAGILLVNVSCNKVFIFSQDSLTDSPCVSKTSSVNVRIKNEGEMPFSKFILTVDGIDYPFNGLRKGESSCYKNIPYIWTNNSHVIYFFSSAHKGAIIRIHPFDYIGEKKIDKGFVTVMVSVGGKFKNPQEIQMRVVEDR
jgi:hypothetical protein